MNFTPGLLCESGHHIHQFITHRVGFFLARLHCSAGAVFEMVFEQVLGDRAQRLLGRGDLYHDIRAIAVCFNHLDDASDLPLRPLEASDVCGFEVRFYAQCAALGA